MASPNKPRGHAHQWTEEEIDKLCAFSDEDKAEMAERARDLLPNGFETILDATRIDPTD